jgi:hypothetical protein
VLTAALFLIAKAQTQPMWYIFTMENYSAIKMKILSFGAT